MPSFHFGMDVFLSVLGLENESFLVFRQNGAKCYPVLMDQLLKIPMGKTLIISLPDPIIMDYSFADETIGRLFADLSSGVFGDRFAVVEVSTVNQFENVEASFVMRKHFGLVRHEGHEWTLVGQRPKGDRSRDEFEETLQIINQKGNLTATELAEMTGLSVTACNNRLFRIHENRLAARTKDVNSREFVYLSLLSRDLLD